MSISKPHLAFLSSGIGSLTPLLRLALKVASLDCKVTLINIQPRYSNPELSTLPSFTSTFPGIEVLDFEINPPTILECSSNDPFVERCEKINRSLYQLNPILSSLQASVIVSDFAISATMAEISADLNIPLFILSTTSPQFFSLVSYLPSLLSEDSQVFSNNLGEIQIPGLGAVLKSNIPPTWQQDLASNHLLTSYLVPNARSLSRVGGVFLNTFEWFEQETIAAINSGSVLSSLPRVFPIGPLRSYGPGQKIPWLDAQPDESVVFVDLGSLETLSRDQITQVKKGLETCGYHYLWLVKGDKNINELEIQEFQKHTSNQSQQFQEPTGDQSHESSSDSSSQNTKGKIFRGWLDQERVLAHRAIGGFVSQCEWESIMHAAYHGVPVLAWPQHGDQMMNAGIVEKTGLGILVENLRWVENHSLVEEKEICRSVKRLMEDSEVKKKAEVVRSKARDVDCGIGESSKKGLLLEVVEKQIEKN